MDYDNTYIGKISIPENTKIYDILYSDSLSSLSRNYIEAFGLDIHNLCFLPPSKVYMISTDYDFNNIICSICLSKNIDNLEFLTPYIKESNKNFSIWYLFNVCTYKPYRSKGYMKYLLDYALKDILKDLSLSKIKNNQIKIYLIVDTKNIKAKQLYLNFGFKIIGSTQNIQYNPNTQNNQPDCIIMDIMELQL